MLTATTGTEQFRELVTLATIYSQSAEQARKAKQVFREAFHLFDAEHVKNEELGAAVQAFKPLPYELVDALRQILRHSHMYGVSESYTVGDTLQLLRVDFQTLEFDELDGLGKNAFWLALEAQERQLQAGDPFHYEETDYVVLDFEIEEMDMRPVFYVALQSEVSPRKTIEV